ncbi:MAG TPA: hypothetical protein VF474_09535 [Phenylobacterium sp.]
MMGASFLLDGGRPGWWCSQDEEAEIKVGVDLILRRHLSGHTTTQPSFIEEEGS